jgi:hypothetical protein
MSIVKSLCKNKDKSCMNYYRPISMLTSFTKVLEVMCNRLSHYMHTNNVWGAVKNNASNFYLSNPALQKVVCITNWTVEVCSFSEVSCVTISHISPTHKQFGIADVTATHVRGDMKVVPLISFFSENIIALTTKFTRMFHTPPAIMRLFFHKVFTIFNTRLPMLSKMLYTSVVKFPDSTPTCVTKTLFQILSAAKWHPHSASFTGPESSWRASDLGCEQGGEEPCNPFLCLPHVGASWCEAGHCH